MKSNMAYVVLYSNLACTVPLELDSNGYYILPKDIVTNNAISPLAINIYAKNEGDHNAYNVAITKIEGDIEVTDIIERIIPSDVQKHTIFIDIPMNVSSIGDIRVMIRYDNI